MTMTILKTPSTDDGEIREEGFVFLSDLNVIHITDVWSTRNYPKIYIGKKIRVELIQSTPHKRPPCFMSRQQAIADLLSSGYSEAERPIDSTLTLTEHLFEFFEGMNDTDTDS